MIRNILKDGTVTDLDGRIIKKDEAESFYKLLEEIAKRKENNDDRET